MKRQYDGTCVRFSRQMNENRTSKSGMSNLADTAHSYQPHHPNRPDANSDVERMIKGKSAGNNR